MRRALVALLVAGCSSSDAAPAPTSPPYDVRSTAAALDAWPLVHPGVQARAVTSFDRAGGNDDGFAGTWSDLGTGSEHVVFDEDGPGVLRTLWFTSSVDGNAPLDLGMLRFWFDGEVTPRIAIDSDALFAGKTPPFLAPLVAANDVSSGGFASWAPLAFARRLRITTERRAGFYQAHWESLPADWNVASWAPGDVDAALLARFQGGASTLPLEEVPLAWEHAGGGTVDVLRFVPDHAPTDDELAAAHLAIAFDGEKTVDLPLAWFFGSGRGLAPVHSVAWTMEPRLFESRLPMPFANALRVDLTGIAGHLFAHVGAARPDAARLEVLHGAGPTTPGEPFVYASATGSGKLIATVLGVDPLQPTTKRWWEGDLRSVSDGARGAAIHGTGHEDDHLGGWSNEFLSRPFSLPMQGCPRTDLLDDRPAFQVNGRATMYRLWPGIPFLNGIVHTTEHGTGNGVSATYAAATFLYRSPRVRLAKTDGFDVASADAAAHAYSAPGAEPVARSGAFEGDPGTSLDATAHRTTLPTSFTLAIAPDNAGVTIRRRFDRHESPAHATLEIDGIPVTSLRTSGPVADAAPFTERDLFVPAALTKGRSSLKVRWVPDSGASANVRFEAWSVLP